MSSGVRVSTYFTSMRWLSCHRMSLKTLPHVIRLVATKKHDKTLHLASPM